MDAVDFKLELTNPSTIYEQEKINLWAEKVRLATDMKALKLLSNNWIYTNIFKLSEDEISEESVNVVYDTFDLNRLNKIEQEGVDPYEEQPGGEQPAEGEQPETGMMAEPSDEQPTQEAADASAENGKLGGRPQMTGDNGTDDNAFGRDPLGKDDITRNFGRETRAKRIGEKLKSVSDKEKKLRDGIRNRIKARSIEKGGKKVINEGLEGLSDDSGSLLDDKNLLPDE
jgi:hypothetical protein